MTCPWPPRRSNLYANNLTGTIPTSLARVNGLETLCAPASGRKNRQRMPRRGGAAAPEHAQPHLPPRCVVAPCSDGFPPLSFPSRNLGSNLLTGTIPPEFGSHPTLIQLGLMSNQLTGAGGASGWAGRKRLAALPYPRPGPPPSPSPCLPCALDPTRA